MEEGSALFLNVFFVVQVAVGTIVTTGTGAKKKEAKRAAALAALEALGVGVASAAAAADAGVESGPSEAADVLDAKAADAPAPAARSSQIAGVLILPRPLSDAVKPTPKASTVSQPAPFAGALASKATKVRSVSGKRIASANWKSARIVTAEQFLTY